jgi:hypothetical protein
VRSQHSFLDFRVCTRKTKRVRFMRLVHSRKRTFRSKNFLLASGSVSKKSRSTLGRRLINIVLSATMVETRDRERSRRSEFQSMRSRPRSSSNAFFTHDAKTHGEDRSHHSQQRRVLLSHCSDNAKGFSTTISLQHKHDRATHVESEQMTRAVGISQKTIANRSNIFEYHYCTKVQSEI